MLHWRLLLLWLLCAGICRAFPTFSGPTGLVVLPDGFTATRLEAAADIVENHENRGVLLRLDAGIAPCAEVGGLYLTDDRTKIVGLNAKLRVAGNNRRIGVSLGALRLDGDPVTTDACYLAASGVIFSRLALTGGVTWTKIASSAGAADTMRPYVGFRCCFPDASVLVGEYQAKRAVFMEERPLTSLMLLRRRSRYLTASIGFSNASLLLGGHNTYVFGGVSYTSK